MKEVVIPVAVFFFLALLVMAGLIFYFRLLQHRTDLAATQEYRKLAEQTVRQQERVETQLTELTARVAAVEELLRSVE
jgi:hypothetical protein